MLGPPVGQLGHADELASLMEIYALSDKEMLYRQCVDCWRFTGNFCDHCEAKDRLPEEKWAQGQKTPLCTKCDREHRCCHFCRGLDWVRPPKPEGEPEPVVKKAVEPVTTRLSQ